MNKQKPKISKDKSYYAVKLWCHLVIGCFHIHNYIDYLYLPIVEQATEKQKFDGCICLSDHMIYFREGKRHKNNEKIEPAPISAHMVKFLREEYPYNETFKDFRMLKNQREVEICEKILGNTSKNLGKIISNQKYVNDTDITISTIRQVRCNELNQLYGDGEITAEEYKRRIQNFGHTINVHLHFYTKNIVNTS